MRIIRELLDTKAEGKGTDINNALDHFLSAMKKRTVAFMLSDFVGEGFEKLLKRAGKKHDFIALQIEDPIDSELPNIGFIPMIDPETGIESWFTSGSKRSRKNYKALELERKVKLEKAFSRSGVDYTTISTDKDFVKPLMQLFDRRG